MKLNDLCMSYGQKTLFENLSFHLNQGLILIKGKSGCGKSTLLKILMEKEKPTSGNLEILDSEKDYLYLGEGTFLLDYLSLKKNISFLLKEKITKETEDKAKKLYVYTLLDTPISKLSSGERQKMELLFALQSRHHTYYFDEPFSSMDKESKKVALELIQEKARDTLCFLIAHEDIECDYDLKILFQDEKSVSIPKELNPDHLISTTKKEIRLPFPCPIFFTRKRTISSSSSFCFAPSFSPSSSAFPTLTCFP